MVLGNLSGISADMVSREPLPTKLCLLCEKEITAGLKKQKDKICAACRTEVNNLNMACCVHQDHQGPRVLLREWFHNRSLRGYEKAPASYCKPCAYRAVVASKKRKKENQNG